MHRQKKLQIFHSIHHISQPCSIATDRQHDSIYCVEDVKWSGPNSNNCRLVNIWCSNWSAHSRVPHFSYILEHKKENNKRAAEAY